MIDGESVRGAPEGVAVLLVEDHVVVREGLRLLLESGRARIRVAGEAGSIAEAHELLATTDVDVVLIDVVLPDGDGIQLCRHVRHHHPATTCVILTSSNADPHLLMAATVAGASFLLTKDAHAGQVLDAVHAAARGERQLDDVAMSRALESSSRDCAGDRMFDGLTEQERRVFALVGQGLSNGQIAETMHLTEKTVKNYVSRMLAKLGMDRRTEAAILAARLASRRHQDSGLVPGPGNPPFRGA